MYIIVVYELKDLKRRLQLFYSSMWNFQDNEKIWAKQNIFFDTVKKVQDIQEIVCKVEWLIDDEEYKESVEVEQQKMIKSIEIINKKGPIGVEAEEVWQTAKP